MEEEPSATTFVRPRRNRWGAWAAQQFPRLLALAAVVTITAAIFLVRHQLRDVRALGYVGVFLGGLLGTGTILLPLPSMAIVFAMGIVINPVLVGLVGALGETLGEFTGYLAGVGGKILLERQGFYGRVVRWMQRHGTITLFLLAAIPNPVFDIAGMAAGATGFPPWRFAAVVYGGKALKLVLIALAGHWGFRFIEPYLEAF